MTELRIGRIYAKHEIRRIQTGRGKNPCGKTVKVDNPYEIYKGNGFEWRVLKKYQMPHMEKANMYAVGIVQ